MVIDLKQLLRENVADAPADHLDVASLLTEGLRRRRTRRTALAGGTAVLAAGALVATLAVAGTGGDDGVDPAGGPPTPDAPTLHLADAERAVAGQDYRVLASQVVDDVDRDDGLHLEGATDDGLVLLRQGPSAGQPDPRFALEDPATGEKDWLPRLRIGDTQTRPLVLRSDQLVLLGAGSGLVSDVTAYFFDRGTERWSGMKWRDLPPGGFPMGDLAPDGRLYVTTPGSQGDASHLWSVSLTDMDDVRDEGLTVSGVAFTDTAMVWTDGTGGEVGEIHVRDLASGEETSFDPNAGEGCDVLGLGAFAERIVLSEFCGTYDDQGTDNRVQILSTDGDQVVTLQGSGLAGWLPTGSDVVNVTVFGGDTDPSAGTYVYDLETDRFLRISDTISSYGLGGAVGHEGQFLWHTPVDDGAGAAQHVGELR